MATMVITEGDEKGSGDAASGRGNRHGNFTGSAGYCRIADESGMLRVLREKIIVQAMLRLSCRRYIEALCSQDEAGARRLFRFYKKLEQLGSSLVKSDENPGPGPEIARKPYKK